MHVPNDVAELTLIVIIVDGTDRTLSATLECNNDNQNWTDVITLPFPPDFDPGANIGMTTPLGAKRYRIRWAFTVNTGSGTCIVAANVNTAHV